jgi:hypothetical protein
MPASVNALSARSSWPSASVACPKAQESGTAKCGVVRGQVGERLLCQHVDVLRHPS